MTVERPTHTTTTGPARFPAGLPAAWAPVLLLLPLAAWIESARRLYAQAGAHEAFEALARSGSMSPGALVGLALALTLGAVLAEAVCLRMVWGARGVTPPFLPLAFVLWLLTTIESCAAAVLARVPPGSAGAVWLAPWVGYRALAGSAAGANGWTFAFAGAGLLTALRIGLSAAAQARLAGRRLREAAALVFAVWLVSHVLLAWMVELSRGRSLGAS